MADANTGTITRQKVKSKVKLSPPKMYKVLLLNDDYTSMDFVISILEKIFNHSPSAAVRIMLQVHNNGSGVAGIYSKQIAETKAMQVHQQARAANYPLLCTVEEAE